MEQNGSRLDRIENLVESLAKSGAETDRRLQSLGGELKSLGEETDRRLKSLGEELNSLGEKTDRRINALLEMMAQHETTQRLANERTNKRVDDVFHGLVLLGPAVERFAESTQLRIDALAEAQRRTENNLNALISVVDGLVRRPPQ